MMNLKNSLSSIVAGLGLLSITACGGGDSGGGGGGNPTPTPPPTVLSTVPADGASNVDLNSPVSAVFSEAMDAASISAATFTLSGGAVSVPGTVTYLNSKASFW